MSNLRDGHRIGELLRACRERAGLTQKELAKLLHMDRTNVVKIETGDIKNPSYTLVKLWAQATNCEDMVGIDLTGGRDGWVKLTKLEQAMKDLKTTMDAVNFMKKSKVVHIRDGQLRERV